MTEGQHTSTQRAQAFELHGRLMLSSLVRLDASVTAPVAFEFTPMTPDAIVGEMQVAIEGEWLGHPNGPFAIDADKMRQCIEVFGRQANPMVVDYEHRSVTPGLDGRAAGWIHELQLRDGGNGAELWATVEWCKPAAEMIRNGEYRYCSPVIDFGPTDRKTGDELEVELFNAALTNNPFLDGMHPIQLSRRVAAADVPPGFKPKAEGAEDEDDEPAEGEKPEGEGGDKSDPFADAPPLPTPSPEETVAGALGAFVDAVMAASGGSKAAVLAALMDGGVSDRVGAMVRDLLDNTDGGASDAQEIPMSDKPENEDDKKAQEIEARAAHGTQTMLLTRLNALEEREKARETEAQAQAEKAADVRISAMISGGQLHEGEREDARWMLTKAPERFERVYGVRGAGSASPLARTAQAKTEDDSADRVVEGDLAESGLLSIEKPTFALLRKSMDAKTALSRIKQYRPTLIANAKSKGVALN